MATKKPSTRLHTPGGVVAFANVFVPRARTDKKGNPVGEPKYSLILSFDEDADLAELKRAAKAAGEAEFGPDFSAGVKKGKYSWPFRNNEEYDEHGHPFDRPGTFVSFKTTDKPGVVDADAEPLMDKSEFYSGCIARVSCKVGAYDNESKGVTFYLVNVQKLDDGERLSGNPAASDDFGAVKGGKKPSKAAQEDDADDDLLG